MLLLNSNSYSKDDGKTDQWQCVINCATIIVDEEKEKNPFLGKWSPSFHCTVKQQAGAVDASTIEHARLIQLDLFFQKMENVFLSERVGGRSFALSNKLVPLMHA